MAISLTRESSRLVWVPAWRKQWGRSQNGQSLFTYMYHLSPYRVPSPPLPRLPSLPLPSRLSPSPLFVSVMFSNSSGARHDTRGVPGLESTPESKLHHCCGFDYDSRKKRIITPIGVLWFWGWNRFWNQISIMATILIPIPIPAKNGIITPLDDTKRHDRECLLLAC